jgi:hypothetical protein
MPVKKVIRLMARLLGFSGVATLEERGQIHRYVKQSEESTSILESPETLKLTHHHLLRGSHYHVVFGEDSEHWYGGERFYGSILDRIFYSPSEAHRFFIDQIDHLLPEFLDDEDIEESYHEFINVTSDSLYEHDEVRGTQGIYFEPLDVRLVYCNSCIPVSNN